MQEGAFMVIDIFCHIIPSEYCIALEEMEKTGRIPSLSPLFSQERSCPGITSLDERFSLMDAHPVPHRAVS
jgi:hypothetical protein